MTTEQAVNVAQVVFGDYQHELANTRKLLERVPEAQFSWKPHDKSLSLGELADHVARLPWFFEVGVRQNEFDLATWQPPPVPARLADVLKTFDERAASALAALNDVTLASLSEPWTLRAGAQVFFTMPRGAILRTFSISHQIHHRAQLTVYLRLLNVAVPGLYGPSADER